MSSISSSPLDQLGLQNLSRLTLDRSRSRTGLEPITNIDITQYRAKSNVTNFLRAHQVPMKEAKEFHANSKNFGDQANQLVKTLEGFGLQKKNLKKAWSQIEKISDGIRNLIKLSTEGLTVKDFARRFMGFGKLLTELVFKDIILDENIDRLSHYPELT
jgi:hypothetical protein